MNSNTREKLISSAKNEFIEKGYQAASLRNICKNAGMTTGALYFFFDNKADLFKAVADPVINELLKICNEHIKLEIEGAKLGHTIDDDMADDSYVSGLILHHLYCHYDITMMLLTKAYGSPYENFVSDIADLMEQGIKGMTMHKATSVDKKCPDDFIIHWLVHQQLDAFIHLITHERDEKKAMEYLPYMVKAMQASWKACGI